MSNRVYKGRVTSAKVEEIKRAWTSEELAWGVSEAMEHPERIPVIKKTIISVEVDCHADLNAGDWIFVVGTNYVDTVKAGKTPDMFEATGKENLDGAEKRFLLINEELKRDK